MTRDAATPAVLNYNRTKNCLKCRKARTTFSTCTWCNPTLASRTFRERDFPRSREVSARNHFQSRHELIRADDLALNSPSFQIVRGIHAHREAARCTMRNWHWARAMRCMMGKNISVCEWEWRWGTMMWCDELLSSWIIRSWDFAMAFFEFIYNKFLPRSLSDSQFGRWMEKMK